MAARIEKNRNSNACFHSPLGYYNVLARPPRMPR